MLKTKNVMVPVTCLLLMLLYTSPTKSAEGKGAGTVTYKQTSSEVTKRADGSLLVRDRSQGVILADDASVPFNLASQDCAGTSIVDAQGKLVVANGYCDAVDKDGDIWWLWWHDGAPANEWTIIGGTGKYEGMTGGGTTMPLTQTADGRLVIRWEGSWKMK